MFATMKLRLVLLAVICAALPACSTMSKLWPFHKKAKPGPEAVHEVDLVNADGSAAPYPQYWVRNTLVLDLSGVGGTGSVTARLPEDTTWPVRVAVRVRPGSIEQLEVLGEERDVLPVTRNNNKTNKHTHTPNKNTPKTAAIYLSWGPAPVFAEAAPAAEPGFVSPQQLPPGVSATPVPASSDPSSASGVIPPGAGSRDQPSPPGN